MQKNTLKIICLLKFEIAPFFICSMKYKLLYRVKCFWAVVIAQKNHISKLFLSFALRGKTQIQKIIEIQVIPSTKFMQTHKE
jgi:hypothetical protein